MWSSELLGGGALGSVSWDDGIAGAQLRVGPDNVLRAATELVDEAAQLRARVAMRLEAMRLEHTGGDPVSSVAVRMLNAQFWQAPHSLAQRCLDYADMLDALADQMAEAAREYGHTEEAIAAAFANRDDEHDRASLLGGDHRPRRSGGSLQRPSVG